MHPRGLLAVFTEITVISVGKMVGVHRLFKKNKLLAGTVKRIGTGLLPKAEGISRY